MKMLVTCLQRKFKKTLRDHYTMIKSVSFQDVRIIQYIYKYINETPHINKHRIDII